MDTKTTASHGKRTIRVEDDMLLRGKGRYVSDAPQPNQLQAYFVRSPHVCAKIKSVDISAALKIKGVVAVLTGKDMQEAGHGSLSQHPPVPGRNGGKLIMPFRPALAHDRVMHIGETVARYDTEQRTRAQRRGKTVPVWQMALQNARLPLYDVQWPPAIVIEKKQNEKGATSIRVGLKDGTILPLWLPDSINPQSLKLNDVIYVKLEDGKPARGADGKINEVR